MVKIFYDPKNEWDCNTEQDVTLEDLFYMVQESHRARNNRTENGLKDMDVWEIDAWYDTNRLLDFNHIEALVPNAHWMESFWGNNQYACLESLEELFGERELTF
jgi:hypothetical protein